MSTLKKISVHVAVARSSDDEAARFVDDVMLAHNEPYACLLISFLITEGRRSFRAPAVSIVACPLPTLNTMPLICLTSP